MTHNRTIHRDTVRPEWVDYNGHLRDAFYMLIFSLSTDAFMDRIGLDDAGRTSRGRDCRNSKGSRKAVLALDLYQAAVE